MSLSAWVARMQLCKVQSSERDHLRSREVRRLKVLQTCLHPVLPQQVRLHHMHLVPIVRSIKLCVEAGLAQMPHEADALGLQTSRLRRLPHI